jgi:hypothetical protein
LLFFKKTWFFRQITPQTRKIKEKQGVLEGKMHPPYSYSYLGLSEIACEAK